AWLRWLVASAVLVASGVVAAATVFPEIPRVPAMLAAALGCAAAAAFVRGTAPRLALGAALTGAAANLAVAGLAPAFARPLLSPAAAEMGRREPVALFWEHPGPYRLSAGWGTQAREVWGDGALGDAIDRGELIFMPDHARHGASPQLLAKLRPVTTWRRTRPYLTVDEVWRAWKTRDLDLLGEDYA